MRSVDFSSLPSGTFFDEETKRAIKWLINTRDADELGWAWVQFIRPNEQNTAEVVATLLEYEAIWEPGIDEIIEKSTKQWLINPERHAKLAIDWSWVLIALVKVRSSEQMVCLLNAQEIEESIQTCISHLIEMQGEDGGWPDNSGGKSITTRTALAVWALCLSRDYWPENGVSLSVHNGTKWLKDTQNRDGGWGNLDPDNLDSDYQKGTGFSLDELSYQCNSNAACTGYALIALNASGDASAHMLKSAAEFLRSSQEKSGGWTIFTEVGIRDGSKYTFRHFSTTWALHGLICQGLADYSDEIIINGINYLAQLQDDNYGGWRSSPDADNYTWATCNALVTIKFVKEQLSEIKAKHFLRIVCEWWDLKRNNTSFYFSVRGTSFAFNKQMGLLFCLIFTVMIFAVETLFGQWIDVLFQPLSEVTAGIIKGIGIITFAAILGLPWIVLIKNLFFENKEGWVNSIGWVYGIVTGFILALYQFIV